MNRKQADTGSKMIHLGKNTKSTIISKGISAGHGQNSYRGLVKIVRKRFLMTAVRMAANFQLTICRLRIIVERLLKCLYES